MVIFPALRLLLFSRRRLDISDAWLDSIQMSSGQDPECRHEGRYDPST